MPLRQINCTKYKELYLSSNPMILSSLFLMTGLSNGGGTYETGVIHRSLSKGESPPSPLGQPPRHDWHTASLLRCSVRGCAQWSPRYRGFLQSVGRSFLLPPAAAPPPPVPSARPAAHPIRIKLRAKLPSEYSRQC